MTVAVNAPAPVRIVVGDAAPLRCAALCRALEAEPGTVVRARATTTVELMRVIEREDVDVVVIGTELADNDAAATCALIKEHGFPMRIVILGTASDAALRAAVGAGADGFVSLDAPFGDLVTAIRRVAGGEAYIPAGMLGGLLRHLIQRRREEDAVVARFATLTRREKEVLALLAEGLNQHAIASRLFVSRHTARTHVQNVLGKLGVHARLEAVALAHEYGLLERFASESKR